MGDKIQAFRQPLVTATGIILGFILNFASSFVKSESVSGDFVSCIIVFCVLMGIVCLIIVLKLVLTMNYPRNNADRYYLKILYLFISGVSIAFIGVMIDMLANFITI
ncbi:hypothetical protein AAIP36_002476 [Flavobacterium psychrophilum]|nr:hypothetical protein [Flavobacterium psychrophilum]